jgi:ATP-dependent Lon protease
MGMGNDFNDNDRIFDGHSKTLLHFYNEEREQIDAVHLWLPKNSNIKQLVAERAKNAEAIRDEKDKKNDEKNSSLKFSPVEKIKEELQLKNLTDRSTKTKIERFDKINLESEKDDLFAEFNLASDELVQVYAWDEPLKVIKNLSAKLFDREVKQRNIDLYNLLKEKGCFRKISGMEIDALAGLKALYDSHPNFSEVIDFVRDQFALCAAQRKAPHFSPCLIYGPPGIGKTDFSQALSEVIGTEVVRIGFDSGITDSTLTGSASHWGNSTTGLLFEKLALGDFINPIFLLDEVDKGDKFQRDPLRALHTILEPVTASRVTDISVGLEINTSHAMWIATGNDPGLISSPLRSRFKEFHVEHPKGADALKLAQTMATKSHANLSLPDMAPVDRQLVKLLAHMTAREQMHALRDAYGKAVANGRREILKSDLPDEVFLDDDDSKMKTSHLH